MLIDNNGQLWSIASKIENVSKDEINQRRKATLGGYEEVAIESASESASEVPYFVEATVALEETVVI